jgi:ElaB/YqjD/DUF883 family membrane-anchored ribosome-binding protein
MNGYCFFILFFLSSCTLFQDIKELASESKNSNLIVATKPSKLKNASRKYPRDNLKYLHLRDRINNKSKKNNYFSNPFASVGDARGVKNTQIPDAKNRSMSTKNIVADNDFPDLNNTPAAPVEYQNKFKKTLQDTLQDDLDELHRELEQLNKNLAKESCSTDVKNKAQAQKAQNKKNQANKANKKKVQKKSKTTTEKCDVKAAPITPKVTMPKGDKVTFAPLGRANKNIIPEEYYQE